MENLYTIDNDAFMIKSNGSDARATTDGINNAILWAKERGYGGVSLTTGIYLIQSEWKNPNITPNDGIFVPSNTILDLANAILKIEPNDYPAYTVIYTLDGSDITIRGGRIIGDRENHIYSGEEFPTHEWGTGISIVRSSRVSVQNIMIEAMTGDAITIKGSGYTNSTDVSISNNILHNCRRQGISVTGLVGGSLTKNIIFDIVGTSPEYGIDIEANSGYEASDISIVENITANCSGGSVLFANGSSNTVVSNTFFDGNLVVGGKAKDISIIENIFNNSTLRIKKGATNVHTVDNIITGTGTFFEESNAN